MIFVYLILMAISVFFYIMYVGNFSYYLMVFMFTMPVLMFLIDLYLSRKVKVYFTQKVQRTTSKTPLRLEVVVSNPTIIPIANIEILLEYNSAVDKGDKRKNTARINTPVMPKECHSMQLNVASLHLGAVDFKIKKCRVFDFLRLFKFKLRGKQYQECMKDSTIFIFPQYSKLENAVSDYSAFGMESDEYSQDKKGDDPSQIFDIHEYVEGDKPNRIHWKLSAKQDQVMVKDYSLPMTFAITIFINLNTDSAKNYDAIIESAMSVSMLLTERMVAHTVCWYDNEAKDLRSINIKTDQDHIDCTDMLIRTKTYFDAEKRIYPFAADDEQLCSANIITVSQPLEQADIDMITESGCSSKYMFVFAVKDPQQVLPAETVENITTVYVQKDRIADAFSDIVF